MPVGFHTCEFRSCLVVFVFRILKPVVQLSNSEVCSIPRWFRALGAWTFACQGTDLSINWCVAHIILYPRAEENGLPEPFRPEPPWANRLPMFIFGRIYSELVIHIYMYVHSYNTIISMISSISIIMIYYNYNYDYTCLYVLYIYIF